MKKILKLFLILLCAIIVVPNNVFFANANENKIYLGGMTAGFSLQENGAHVVGLCDVITESGIVSPAKEAGVQIGDKILLINNNKISNAYDIEKSLLNNDKKVLSIERKGEHILIDIIPAKDCSGKYKLGVFVRDNVKGIGTITYIKDNYFASLGHPVVDDEGKLLKIDGGDLYSCVITDVHKGERGKPGELHGVFVGKSIGKIKKNTECGVYGTINIDKSNLTEIEPAKGEPGEAYIYSTIDGNEIIEYKILIIKAEMTGKESKNYVIKIVDDRLIDKTGGIVQGMSGSPIVQNGKLVGAITHVFINDPLRGFGISIDNMLKH